MYRSNQGIADMDVLRFKSNKHQIFPCKQKGELPEWRQRTQQWSLTSRMSELKNMGQPGGLCSIIAWTYHSGSSYQVNGD